MIELDQGRAPDAAGEVAASPEVLARAGIDIGGTLALSQPDVELRVTGTVIEAQNIRGATLVVPPGALDAVVDDGVAGGGPAERRRWLVAVDGDPAEVASRISNEYDHVATATTRAELSAQPVDPGPVNLVFVIGALALFEAALMAGAAFAVGARRQTRSLGLVAATGGERRHLAGVVLLGGDVVGAVGAGVGIVVGLAASLALAPSLDRITGALIEAPVIPPIEVAGAGVLGLVAATAAAWLPARSVARIPTMSVLAGRRPLSLPRRLASLAGVGAVAGGCGLAALGAVQAEPLLIVAGAIAVVAGFAAWSPTLVGALGHLAPDCPPACAWPYGTRPATAPGWAPPPPPRSWPPCRCPWPWPPTRPPPTPRPGPATSRPWPTTSSWSAPTGSARTKGTRRPSTPLREASEAIVAAVPGTMAAPVMKATLAAGDGTSGPDEGATSEVIVLEGSTRGPGATSDGGPSRSHPPPPWCWDRPTCSTPWAQERHRRPSPRARSWPGDKAWPRGMIEVGNSTENPACTPALVAPCGGVSFDASSPLSLPAVEVDSPAL